MADGFSYVAFLEPAGTDRGSSGSRARCPDSIALRMNRFLRRAFQKKEFTEG